MMSTFVGKGGHHFRFHCSGTHVQGGKESALHYTSVSLSCWPHEQKDQSETKDTLQCTSSVTTLSSTDPVRFAASVVTANKRAGTRHLRAAQFFPSYLVSHPVKPQLVSTCLFTHANSTLGPKASALFTQCGAVRAVSWQHREKFMRSAIAGPQCGTAF